MARGVGRRGRAFATLLLATLLATLATTRATASDDPDATSRARQTSHLATHAVGGAEKPHELRVGDAAPRRITATTPRPSVTRPKMMGNSRAEGLSKDAA